MQANREFFAALKLDDWFSWNQNNYNAPAGCYRLVKILGGIKGDGYGQIFAEIVDAIEGRAQTAYLNQWNVAPVAGKPVIRCAHCDSDNSGGLNGWSGRSEGSFCRCWDGSPDYEYMGLKPLTKLAKSLNG